MSTLNTTEYYLYQLPAGSYFQRLRSGFSVKVYRPTLQGGWKTFNEDRLADAFEAAVGFVSTELKMEEMKRG